MHWNRIKCYELGPAAASIRREGPSWVELGYTCLFLIPMPGLETRTLNKLGKHLITDDIRSLLCF